MSEKLKPLPVISVEPDVSIDGETTTLTLIAPDGSQFPLGFDRQSLATFASRAMRAHLLAESRAAAQGGHAEMPAVDAERAHAQNPFGASNVVLTVLTKTPSLQHWSLSPTQAETLASELQEAAGGARASKSNPRH